MILRPYQLAAVEAIRLALGRHRAVCLALQVGGGKTVVACEIIRLVLARERRALFVVHRIELVEQARDRLAAFGIAAGIIKAGFLPNPGQPVQVACVPSLVRREFPPADLVILDEAHHSVSASWLRVVRHYRDAGSWVLGITATPQRLDGKPLGDVFDAIVEPVTTAQLVAGGFLIAPKVYAPDVDLRGLKTRAGDYSLPELAQRLAPLCGHTIETWGRLGRGMRTLAFAVTIEHSQMLEDGFRAAGARAMHVDGTSSPADRALANAGLRAGTLDVVTQCQLWTEGVDIPELECLVIARPTKSLGLHRQMLGRVMRPAHGKTGALVLDHAGNHHEHGMITDEIGWSLTGRAKRHKTAEPVRTCKECFAVLPVGATECPECGAPVPVGERETPGINNPGELAEFKAKRKATATEKMAEYRRLLRVASARSYKIGWSKRQYHNQFGVWPRGFGDIERAEYRCAGHEPEEKTYGYKTVRRCGRCHVNV